MIVINISAFLNSLLYIFSFDRWLLQSKQCVSYDNCEPILFSSLLVTGWRSCKSHQEKLILSKDA